jgi:hypothetical protein
MSVPPPAITLPKSHRVVQSHPRVVQSHPKILAPQVDQNNRSKPQHPSVLKANRSVVHVHSGKPILTLWGSSHLVPRKKGGLGRNVEEGLRSLFQRVINLSRGGAQLTDSKTKEIKKTIRSHPGPTQVYVFLFGGNNLCKTDKPILEVARVVSRFCMIMIEAQKAGIKVLLCGKIPDPDPVVDEKLKLLDNALQDLDMGPGNRFIGLRHLLFENEKVELKFYRRGDIHLSEDGVKVMGLRIQQTLEVMCLPKPAQNVAQDQTAPVVSAPPVVVQTPVVQTPLIAQVQAPVVVQPAVVQTPVVVQPLVVVQLVAVPDQIESLMEVEDEDTILQRLFFKKFRCALPEVRVRSKVDEINMNLIDLTNDDDEMEVATPAPVQAVVKTEQTEVVEVAEVAMNNANPNAPTDRQRCRGQEGATRVRPIRQGRQKVREDIAG